MKWVNDMKITVLAENTAKNNSYKAEHGLSLCIETADKRILFDMGQSDLFAENAKKLGVDLSAVDMAVLSHGHYDHGGGLETFLKINEKAQVFVSSHAFGDYYNATDKYIGLDKKLYETPRLTFVTNELTPLAEGVSLVSLNGYITGEQIDSAGLIEVSEGVKRKEEFLHEIYLVIQEKGRRIVFSGCSHKGALNIAKLLKPDVFVGGFHFSKIETEGCSAQRLTDVAEELLNIGGAYYTCHCTGVPQYDYLKTVMGERLHYLSTGTIVTF